MKKPKLLFALRLRCVLCGRHPLQKKGSWFTFNQGCSSCCYLYEREEGYFTGAAWVIGYGFLAVALLGFALITYTFFKSFSPMQILLTSVSLSLPSCLLFFPYSRSLWMYMDHYFHPLEALDDEQYKKAIHDHMD